MNYSEFVSRKLCLVQPTGLQEFGDLPAGLFPHQDALTRWALRRGRSAIFADTGLGKTRMELAWADAVARETGRPVLILAPLAVAAQTVREAAQIGLPGVVQAREAADCGRITVTNYDRLHKFDPEAFGAVVLDESSIIKHHTSKTLQTLLDAFARTPFKLCATATPAPNDWTELGTHAEFLGICSRTEMLSEYFVHDAAETQVWRIKGHARGQFWRFVSSWGAMLRKPSDLGFDDAAYKLPPLEMHEHTVSAEVSAGGMLFALEAQTLSERRDARRASLSSRVAECAALVNADRQPWIVWCDLNAEADALKALIPDAVEVRGPDDVDVKEQRLLDFAEGRARVLISKPSICGWGLNWQHCRRIAFVGVTDSYEAFYQAIRRCWRFGQTQAVHAHIFASDLEGAVIANLKRKEADAASMAESLSAETRQAVMAEVFGQERRTNTYSANSAVKAPHWLTSEAA